MVAAALDKGVDVNTRDENGSTPLILACMNAQVGVVKLLLERGADVKAKNNDGYTALSATYLVHIPRQPQQDRTGMITIVDDKVDEKDQICALLTNHDAKTKEARAEIAPGFSTSLCSRADFDCLSGRLSSGDRFARSEAVKVLGESGGARASQLLLIAINDEDEQVRLGAL
jgi:HEAT repeat protein